MAIALRNLRKRWKKQFIMLLLIAMVATSFSNLVAPLEAEAASPANLVASYDFNGGFSDSLGNSQLSVVSGTYGGKIYGNTTSAFGTDLSVTDSTYWRWTSNAQNGGGFTIDLDDSNISDHYSIGLRFSFDSIPGGYAKIIDYKNKASDHGFYFNNGKLNFYPTSTGNLTTAANQVVDIIATRDSTTQKFIAYMVVDGVLAKQIETVGSNSVPEIVNGKVRFGFFHDDYATTGEKTTGGKVYSIKFWDGPITQEQAQGAMNTPAPEAALSTATAMAGAAPGTTKLTAAPGVGHTLAVRVSNAAVAVPNIGEAAPTGTGVINPYASGADISGVDATTNKYVGIYEIDALGKIVAFKMITLTAGEISPTGAASAPGGVAGGLVSWVNVEKSADSKTAVGSLEDLADSSRTWSQSGTMQYDAAAINFNAGIQAAGNYYRAPSFGTTDQQREVFTVQTSKINDTANRFPWDYGGNHGLQNSTYGNKDGKGNIVTRFGSDTARSVAVGEIDLKKPHLLGAFASDQEWALSIDGKQLLNETSNSVNFDPPDTNNNVYYIGAGHFSVFQGDISEIIVYDHKLTPAEKLKVNSYLALKYGLTLNNGGSDYAASNFNGTTGTKMWSAADNAGFGQRITGIGKDSASGLEQKQSKSQENGALVTIAAGNEIKASNEAYPADTIQNDLSFLTFGDNGGDAAYNVPINGTNLQRMARTFKVDKTNWNDGGVVTLQLDGTPADKTTYIVVNSDSGFAGTLQVAPLTNGKITLNSSDLADGSYFTFAQEVTISKAPGGISGASLWLKADKDATANGADQLTGWTDQTGINQFEVKGTPVYKTEAANFNPSVSFENTAKPSQNPNQYLIGDNQITYRDGYIVFKQTDGTAVGSAAPRPGGYGAAIFSKWGKLYVGNGATGTYRGFSFNDPSRYNLAAFDAAASIEAQGRLNGTPQTVAGDNSFNQIDFTPVIGGTIGGGNPNNWSHFKGEIAEVVLFPTSHNVQEKQKIESYLALKYGLTLNGGKTDYIASNGSQLWTANNNQGYGNRITGIGRDDSSDLHQKQSKSQVQGALVTVALGDAVQASNAANANTIDADSSFFVFSDNGVTAKYETNVPEAPGHTLKQLNRLFKVEKSNWQDRNITLKLDVTAENPAVLYYLIIDGVNSGIKLDASGQATFDSSLLGNGSLFTFAKVYKNALQTKLTGIKGMTESNYTPESWATLQTALADAEAVLNNPDSTQEQVDAALAALETARTNLVSEADKLKAKKDEVQNEITIGTLKPGDYTVSSWAKLTKALDDANALLNRTPQATPVEIGQALSELESSRVTLVDLSKLRAKEAEIAGEQLNPATYTPNSWQVLQQALTEAQAVLTNPDATQAEVDEAKAALEKARAELVPAADKTALQAKKDAVGGEGLTETEFTPESWAVLQNALVQAETVLNDPEATQEEVDAVLAVLIAARNNLVKAGASLETLNPVYPDGNGNPVPMVLSPQFDGKQYLNYESVVPNTVDKISIDPKTVDPTGTVTVTLNGQPVNATDWSNLPLQEGLNVIKVETTGPDGSKNVYTIEVMRVTGKLVSLTPSSGSMVPAFNPAEKAYNMSVPNSVYALQWAPVALDPLAVIEINVNGGPFAQVASGTASEALPLHVGVNTIIVKVTDRDGGITEYTITVSRRPNSSNRGNSGGGGSGSGPSGPGTSNPTDIVSSVNGNETGFATGTEDTSGDRTQTLVTIDGDKLADLISQGNGQKFTVRVPNDGDVETKGLTAELVRQLTDTGSTLEIGNLLAIYPVPGGQLNLDDISKKLNNAALGDIEVHVGIKRASEALIDSAKAVAAAEGYELLVSPVDLKLSFSNQGQTVGADQLNGFAAKYIALPEGIDPNRITTGVVINPDGTVFHIPTVVTKINDRYFALLNDLRSSGTYSVIWNPQDLDDVKAHWARPDVNDIVARLVLAGTGNNTFTPDRNVVRSEFAAIVATGMGLMRQNVTGNSFGDVLPASWYHDSVTIASEFGIVNGYEDGLFHGDRQITREQGIAMIARAYELVEPKSSKTQAEIETILSSYGDAANVSDWAKEAVARMIAAGIVEGRDGQLLRPQENMTRAEAAALMRRLLQTTNLID